MSKGNPNLNPISNIFSPVHSSPVRAENISAENVFKAAAGSLSLELAAIKWNDPEFLNTIFALVIKNKDNENIILKRDRQDIRFQYQDPLVCVSLKNDLASAYEVKAVLCKDRSGLKITDGKIRYMNSGEIYELADGLKIFVQPEKEITKAEAQSEDKAPEPQDKKSKHLLGEEDVRLLNEAIAGNANSLAMYFHRLRNRLIGYAKLSNIDEAKSEDAVQEAFIVIFNKMAEGNWSERDFKSPFQLAKFIGGVIRNRAFNIGKLACNRYETSLDDGLEGIDPDKQEHHISAKSIRSDSDMELAADPLAQLETFDAALFLEAVGKYTEQNNTPSLSILREFMIAHLDSGGECVEHDFSKGLGMKLSQLSAHLKDARLDLERVGLGKRALMDGAFPTSTSTVRLASTYLHGRKSEAPAEIAAVFTESVTPLQLDRNHVLGGYYKDPALYDICTPDFTLGDLINSYNEENMVYSTIGFYLRGGAYAHISVSGMDRGFYSVSKSDDRMILHIYEQEMEVVGIAYQNGTVLFIGDNKLEVFSPKDHSKITGRERMAPIVAEPVNPIILAA